MFHLKPKPEPALRGRARDPGPGRRLLGRHDHARHLPVRDLVQLAQEGDGLEVLVAAVLVRHPLARLARVVAVEHRRDRVDAQAVGVEPPEPVEGVRDQEVAHLGAAVVEDERPPVGVRAAARVLVLVQRRAVEAREGELVAREVGRHPVEDHAEARAVEAVDERAQRRPASRSARWARSSRSSGTPTSPRTGAPSPAAARRG